MTPSGFRTPRPLSGAMRQGERPACYSHLPLYALRAEGEAGLSVPRYPRACVG